MEPISGGAGGTGDGGGKVDSTLALAQYATRPLVTMILVAGFCWGFFYGKVSGETYAAIVATVVGFWFGQRSQDIRTSDRSPSAAGTVATTTGTTTGAQAP